MITQNTLYTLTRFNDYKIVTTTFQATDRDTGKHVKVQYSLRGADAKDFVINSDTGTIYCTRLVDDNNANKMFEVVAKDNDGKSEESESVLTVTVKIVI